MGLKQDSSRRWDSPLCTQNLWSVLFCCKFVLRPLARVLIPTFTSHFAFSCCLSVPHPVCYGLQSVSPRNTRYQTSGFCMLGTPHTKAHCKRAKVPYMHIGGVVQENLWGSTPSCDRSEGSRANLRGSGLPASPLSSAPPNYAVKVTVWALHMPQSVTAPRNKLSRVHRGSVTWRRANTVSLKVSSHKTSCFPTWKRNMPFAFFDP